MLQSVEQIAGKLHVQPHRRLVAGGVRPRVVVDIRARNGENQLRFVTVFQVFVLQRIEIVVIDISDIYPVDAYRADDK